MKASAPNDAIGLAGQLHFEQTSYQQLIVGAAEVTVAASNTVTIRGPAQDAADAYVVRERVPTAEILVRPPHAGRGAGSEREPDIGEHRSIAAAEGTGLEPGVPFAAVLLRRIGACSLDAGLVALGGWPFCRCRVLRLTSARARDQKHDCGSKQDTHRSLGEIRGGIE